MSKKEASQDSMFEQFNLEEKWREEWQDMPEFVRDDNEPFQKIIISFETRKDVQDFAKLINQRISNKTISLWYPKKEYLSIGMYFDESEDNNKKNES